VLKLGEKSKKKNEGFPMNHGKVSPSNESSHAYLPSNGQSPYAIVQKF